MDTPVGLLVTGFGPFLEVQDNPTAALIGWLDRAYKDGSIRAVETCTRQGHGDGRPPHDAAAAVADEVAAGMAAAAAGRDAPPGVPHAFPLAHACVLPVAARAVDAWLYGPDVAAALAGDPSRALRRQQLLVHFGVSRDTGFKLETAAYNRACFRGADQDGWQPVDELIDCKMPLDAPLQCRLPLDAVAAQLSSAGFDVALSTDPGRFVCNYIYYRSLQRTRALGGVWSVFVHVPHFEHVPEATQRRFVSACLQALAAAVAEAAAAEAAEAAVGAPS